MSRRASDQTPAHMPTKADASSAVPLHSHPPHNGASPLRCSHMQADVLPRSRSSTANNADYDNAHALSPDKALSLSPFRTRGHSRPYKLFSFLRAIFHLFPAPPLACRWLARAPSRRSHFLPSSAGVRALTGTLFGQRKGHVHFAVQDDPNAVPFLLLELATPTNTLVKEMASGLVRIALECERTQNRGKLLLEQVWTMYCNGRKTGYAIRRECTETDLQVFSLVRAVSMGAGVLPVGEEGPDGELMYMRARFERVVGSRDSEAFYMMNPDGTGGPELSIFLLRI
ncbi:hypothetical protein GOP47_0014055 [Adiantum capillus-veneris]|uniref:Protein MIZU-KUSSEI 1 n=1 Tax=Adiantum capillus-veneris TaxID=13818 RepID=A0A9D4UQ77_ADICA|nr:hypothetical protein GOP47_0014055 [Adiantum capillus-veneris]